MIPIFSLLVFIVTFTLVMLLKLLYDREKSHEGMIDQDAELVSAPMSDDENGNNDKDQNDDIDDNIDLDIVTNFKPTIDQDSKPYTEQRIDMSNVKQPSFPIKYDSIGKYNRLFELSNKDETFEIPRV
jgi:hypothetical protein